MMEKPCIKCNLLDQICNKMKKCTCDSNTDSYNFRQIIIFSVCQTGMKQIDCAYRW